MGKKQLADFLTQLSTDAAVRARYESDPGAAMSAAGLDTADRIALASGDADRLEAYLGEKPAMVIRTAVIQAATVSTPVIQETAVQPAAKPVIRKPVIRKPVIRKPVIRMPPFPKAGSSVPSGPYLASTRSPDEPLTLAPSTTSFPSGW